MFDPTLLPLLVIAFHQPAMAASVCVPGSEPVPVVARSEAEQARLVASLSRGGCAPDGVSDFEDIVRLSSWSGLEPTRIVYIDASAPLGGDGSSWQSAYQSLHDALNAESFDDEVVEIRMAGGVYRADRVNGQNTLDPDLTYLIPGLVGTGTDLHGLKRISGGYAGRDAKNPDERDLDLYPTVFTGDLLGDDTPDFANYADNTKVMFNAGAVDLNGITIEHARIGASSVRWMTDSTVRWCFASGDDLPLKRDDRVPVLARDARIVGNTFHNNRGEAYGGSLSAEGLVVVANSRFLSNTAPGGGAIGVPFGRFAQLVIQNCFFSGNSADGDIGGIGGAIYHHNGNAERLQIVHCTFTGNWSLDGGGFGAVAPNGPCNIRNSVFDQNFSFSGTGVGSSVFVGEQSPQENILEASVFRRFNVDQEFGLLFPYPSIRFNIDADPGFVNLLGPDGLLGTPDDDPALAFDSASIGRSVVPPTFPGEPEDLGQFDLADLDGDCDLTEPIPVDFFGNPRAFESEPGEGALGYAADAGCVEYVPGKGDQPSQPWTFPDLFVVDESTEPIRLYVDGDRPSGGDGLSWESAFTDPTPALEIAAQRRGSVEIWVAAGEYAPTSERSGLYSFRIIENVTMLGGFAGNESSVEERDWLANETVLTGDRLGNDDPNDPETFTDNASMVVTSLWPRGGGTLDGFTVRDGSPRTNLFGPGIFWTDGRGFGQPFSAGLVYLGFGDLTARNCSVETAGVHARSSVVAVSPMQATLDLVDSRVTGIGEPRIISERRGIAGELLDESGRVIISGCEIDIVGTLAAAWQGFWTGGRVEVSDSRVTTFVEGNPFALPLFRSASPRPVVISNCEINSNRVGFRALNVEIISSTFNAELFVMRVDAIGSPMSRLSMTNSILPADQLTTIRVDAIEFVSSIVSGNRALLGDPIVDIDDTNIFFGENDSLADFFVDPLGPDGEPYTGDEDLRLAPASPAINTGLNAFVDSDFDLDGNDRIIGTVVDRGAYEFTGTCTGDVNGDGVIDLGDLNLVLSNFGEELPFGDASGDGTVDITDLNIVLAGFGQVCPG
jgi:hypothetical protein